MHTIIEKVLDEISFTATDRGGETIIIDKNYVTKNLGELVKDTDLSKFIYRFFYFALKKYKKLPLLHLLYLLLIFYLSFSNKSSSFLINSGTEYFNTFICFER